MLLLLSFFNSLVKLFNAESPFRISRPLLDTLPYTLYNTIECRVEYLIIKDLKMRYETAIGIFKIIYQELMKERGARLYKSKNKLMNKIKPGLKGILKKRHHHKKQIYNRWRMMFWMQMNKLLMRYTTTNNRYKITPAAFAALHPTFLRKSSCNFSLVSIWVL